MCCITQLQEDRKLEEFWKVMSDNKHFNLNFIWLESHESLKMSLFSAVFLDYVF